MQIRRPAHSGQAATDPSTSFDRRIRGRDEVTVPPAPGFPLCVMGLPLESATLVSGEVEPVPSRKIGFKMGRRRYEPQYSAAWQALFAPIEWALGPATPFCLASGRLCSDVITRSRLARGPTA